MKSVCAVVNARLDTTGLPRKLVRPFAGTTLLEVALDKLNRMDFFASRYVAITDDELKPVVSRFENLGILDWKPAPLQQGRMASKETFAYYLSVPSEYIFVLEPSFPFLTAKTVQHAVEIFRTTDFPSYISGVESRDWIFDREGNALTNSDPRNVTTNVGRLFYKAVDAFRFIQRDFFRRHGCFWSLRQNDPHVIPIPEAEAVQVRNEIEFMYAEFCYTRQATTMSAS